MSENEREELAWNVFRADNTNAPTDIAEAEWDRIKGNETYAHMIADGLLAAGYRKAERATEFGTIFNRAAVFLNPPAESVEEFRERYESEFGWMLTERDPILTKTFLRCDPEPSEPALHAEATL